MSHVKVRKKCHVLFEWSLRQFR